MLTYSIALLLLLATTVAVSQLSDDDDCAIRRLGIEYARSLEPRLPGTPLSSTNWSALVAEAMQVGTLCPGMIYGVPKQNRAQESMENACDWTVYVADNNGNDSNPGTFASPFKSVHRAVAMSRARSRSSISPCIFVRSGTYYFGAIKPRTFGDPNESAIGGLQLTAVDSGLTITAYQREAVTFSAGQLIQPDWSVYKKLSAGTVYQTKLPASIAVDWDHFNELYLDGVRAVRAKYPNGDPSTHGDHTLHTGTGFIQTAQRWTPPLPPPNATEIHYAAPRRDSGEFGSFQTGIGGAANNFHPPASFWAMRNPPAGGGLTYVVPRGVTWNASDISPHVPDWSNPSTGYCYVFHGDLWGSWVFAIDSVDVAARTIQFGKGGWQEGRGYQSGGMWYITNIFEELDAPNEWFVDSANRTLYYMRNDSASAPNTFVASQLPCILSIRGTSKQPATNITINGIVFTHSSNTHMKPYMVPSSGDWTIHRGGAIVLSGTKYVTFSNNLYTQLGSNALVLTDSNINTTIISSEFSWIGDSGIILSGSVEGINGVSSQSQPIMTYVANNLFRELGIYTKQSGPFFQAQSRSTRFLYNVAFNHPRASFNFNDGFYGDHEVAHNFLFNSVRESDDHGPINSWDRQTYMTEDPLNGITVGGRTNNVHHNLCINGYGANWPLDHDDGSAFYNDHSNVLVFGGFKSSGHNTSSHNNIYLFPDNPRPIRGTVTPIKLRSNNAVAPLSSDRFGVVVPQLGATCRRGGRQSDRYMDNQCLLCLQTGQALVWVCNVDVPMSTTIFAARNHYYYPDGIEFVISCIANKTSQNLTLTQYESFGYDLNSTQSVLPSQQDWMRSIRELLDF